MRILLLILLLTVVPCAALAQLAGMTEIQISSPQHAGSDVETQSLVYSPDGAYVCFIGDTETDGAGELWCADTDSGAPAVRVSGLMPGGKSVEKAGFDASGDRVFYIAPGTDVEKEELFVVAPDGSQPPVRLSAPLVPSGADVTNYRYLPDTDQVLYTAASQVSGETQLHIVSVDQPEVVTVLNGSLVSGGDVLAYEVVPAAGRVVYRADQQVDAVEELYSVLLNGAGAVKLNGPLVGNGDVVRFRVSPDGTRVAYRADEDVDGVHEIFVTPIEGGGSTKVSGPAVAGGDAWHFDFSPDSQWLLFTGDLATDGWRDLYSTPVDGSQSTPNVLATQVKEAPSPPVLEVSPSLFVTSDGSQVLFQSQQGNLSTVRALRVPIDGSSGAVVLSGGLTEVTRLQYVPGLERILVQNGSAPGNLYSIAVDSSSFVPLTSFSNASINVIGLATPGGVLYQADPQADGQTSVFFVDYLGQATRELTSTSAYFEGLAANPNVYIAEDRGAVYFVERHGSSIFGVYSFRLKVVELDTLATTELARIGNSIFVSGEKAFLRMRGSPTNRYQVAYIADKSVDEQADAYLATFTDGVFGDRFEAN